MNVQRETELKQLNYSSKDTQILMREFVLLLDELSTNYETAINRLETNHRHEVEELKSLLLKYEEKYNKSIKKTSPIKHLKHYLKVVVKKISKGIFKVVKDIASILKIKEPLKRLKLYKLLYKYFRDIN